MCPALKQTARRDQAQVFLVSERCCAGPFLEVAMKGRRAHTNLFGKHRNFEWGGNLRPDQGNRPSNPTGMTVIEHDVSQDRANWGHQEPVVNLAHQRGADDLKRLRLINHRKVSLQRFPPHLVVAVAGDRPVSMLMPGASDYQSSKHAINRLCEFVQSDHGKDGIKCFAVHPGGVATDLGHNMPENMHEYLVDKPDLAACFVVWLASGKADWAKGRYLSANWDVNELQAARSDIETNDLFVNRLRA